MNNELITEKNERVSRFMESLERMLKGMERLAAGCRPVLNGERYLTDKELSARLKVSRRTLQDYRNEGRIPYILLGGKILYRESDIEKMLEEGYREAFRCQD
ncbi:helix-turn-helix domain-containing protein [Odoribacter lunatus]|uniref:helix-turn-helix domain-containing protein n=1 Tax=Odoribacter lunatus TaxID=2941335 RepID=UPI002041C8C9|nr:helix-turn-helix domain-containing protein [Odoribacter lunatus]